MRFRALLLAFLIGACATIPAGAKRHTPKVAKHANTAPRPAGRKTKKFKAKKLKAPKSHRVHRAKGPKYGARRG